MEEHDIIDQSQLAESVSEKIKYTFEKHFLVKPLDPVIVTKEFDKPIPADTAKKDTNGIEAIDYDNVEKEVKEVESDFTKGVVLKVPYRYEQQLREEKWAPMPIKCGDVIIFKSGRGMWFDLLKDTKLVEIYDVIGIEIPKDGSTNNVQ